MTPLVAFGLLYATLAYLVDVVLRRQLAARAARLYADAQGRPLLNVGAGTARSALFGATLYGDINVDIQGRRDLPHGPHQVTYGDAQQLPFATGSMGAVLASHVLEHLPDPEQALDEFARVAGSSQGVFVVTPHWWAPHTWLHPGHRWFFSDGRGGGLRMALWRRS